MANFKSVFACIKMLTILLLPHLSFSNNLTIGSVTLVNDSTLSFSVSWDNSWKTASAPYNHDAVWLFIKKRDCASLQWSHVNLSPVTSSHTTESPLEIYIDGRDASTNSKGVFVRRSTVGSGSVVATTVTLRMRNLPSGEFDFKVFGIEMVQIPSGAYYLGDGTSTGTFKTGSTTNPFLVSSEAAITAGSAATNLYAATSASYYPVTLPASFPKGFKEIYCMKYEISQGQYVDFVNTLTSDQAVTRQVVSSTNRLAITGTWPSIVAGAPHRAMTGINWYDLVAYLDWSALRPMTELEFEKIARGTLFPVSGEFAWGSNIITDANTLASDGTPTENSTSIITAGGGIANYANTTILGPVRCGFAAKPGTNRLTAGATYYGVMEMSGNAAELLICTTDGSGSGFTGVLGDGEVTQTPAPGNANVTAWPSVATGNVGACNRGGSWNQAEAALKISDRSQSNTFLTARTSYTGGRGVR